MQHIAEHSQQIIVPQHRIVTANCGQMQQVCHMPTAATSHAPILAQSYHHDSKQPPVRGKTSPYGFFVKMCYEEHKKKYPTENVQVTEISKKCSQKWKTMSDDEKKRFVELAQKDAERYQAEVAAYGGDDLMRKRKRAKKDPNAPKRALSAFFLFSKEKRPEVQQRNPNWKVGQIAQELGRFWKSLTDEERQIYEKRALEDKERYAEEMQSYRTSIGKNLRGQQKQTSSEQSNGGLGAAQPTTHDDIEHTSHEQLSANQLPIQLLDDQLNFHGWCA